MAPRPQNSDGATAPATWPTDAIRASIALITFALVALSALAWWLTGGQRQMVPDLTGGGSMDSGMDGMGMASGPMGIGLFLAMWVTMMVAMMFPSVAPMVIAQWRVSRRKGNSAIAVPLFVGGYLLSWTGVGLVAYALYRGIVWVAPSLPAQTAALLAGGALVAAGVYQFTPFKTKCLAHCRSPMDFFFHWRDGYSGALRMGAEHGAYCVGCCWGLMLVLFVVGLMSLAWMGVIAAVIFIEKVTPFGQKATRWFGAAIAAFGIGVAVWPVFGG